MEGKVCDIWAQIILILMEQLRLICSDYPTIIASNLNIVQFPHQLDTVWSVCLSASVSLSPNPLQLRWCLCDFCPFYMQILFTGQRSADSVIKVRVQGLSVSIYKGKRLSQSSTTQKKVTEPTLYHVKYPCKELHVIFT